MRYVIASCALMAATASACSAQEPPVANEPTFAAAEPEATPPPSDTPEESADAHPQARLYDAAIDARQTLEAALVRARINGTLVLVAMGANWCHDSRAFAGWMETERFKALVAEKYELIYINVGMPQSQDGHNLDIAERFGVEVEGTPTVLLLTPEGEILNKDSAASWRNTASRSEDEIYDELALMATTEIVRD